MPEQREAAASRREQLFIDLVLPELKVLLRVALSMTSQPADAEDLVQETLLRAYRSMDRFDGAYPRAWLLTIMRRANTYRRPAPLPVGDSEAVGRLDREPEDEDEPGQVTDAMAFDSVVASLITTLPRRQQEVVRLVDVGGLSYAEAARMLGIPEGSVRSRLHRARSQIRRRLVAAGITSRKGMS